jgi:diguanylate cyclase
MLFGRRRKKRALQTQPEMVEANAPAEPPARPDPSPDPVTQSGHPDPSPDPVTQSGHPNPSPDPVTQSGHPNPSPNRAAPPLAGVDGAAADGSLSTSAGNEPVTADRAIDLSADLLRILGEHAFDLGPQSANDIRDFFEAWARHLLLGVVPPGPEGAQTGEPSVPGSRRDLAGLRRAVREHRTREANFVTESTDRFRDATWAFISGLRRSLTVEQNADRRIGHRMRRLEGAVRSGDATKIRNEAQETVRSLTEFLAERGQHHQAQIEQMAAKLQGMRDELDDVRKKAAIDPLTGLYNRAAFDEQIEREIDLATLFGWRSCLIMVDVDHFKWVNDNRGHPCGDQVLRELAETLSRCFMRSDDFVARYGGEEFVLILRDLTLPQAADLAERGMHAIRNLEINFGEGGEPLRVTASMGIARLRPREGAAAWIERADRALYQAKDSGRDRVMLDPLDLEEA